MRSPPGGQPPPVTLFPFLLLRPQLIDVLALPKASLSDEKRAHALRVLNGLLTTQEHKLDAVGENAAGPIVELVRSSEDAEVLQLSCEALASLSQVQQGRSSISECHGIPALTDALVGSPEAAAGAFRVSMCEQHTHNAHTCTHETRHS